ncbi:MAG: 16S rRNA (guanine(966)-N(2))-methyltransferase RsmD [Chloroflexi bacterium RBG_13_56_8]|nr:MAG: 16S rRNA (guanine(966)-N(2))-methyltransferase RsmD [Chloroflexi bacterium RBG_13_56_8]
MRVIAGAAKGRRLKSVSGSGTRPITDRVKGALFDILGGDIVDATLLDLFAGTGSVGIEALSRGAARVVFVERARKAAEIVRQNLQLTGFADRAEVIQNDAFRYLRGAGDDTTFDYIYIAPPQYQGLWAKVLRALNEKPLLAADGLAIVQIHPKELEEIDTPTLHVVEQRHYGSTLLVFYERNQRDGGMSE